MGEKLSAKCSGIKAFLKSENYANKLLLYTTISKTKITLCNKIKKKLSVFWFHHDFLSADCGNLSMNMSGIMVISLPYLAGLEAVHLFWQTDSTSPNGHREKWPRLTDWYVYQSTSRNDFISVIQLSQRDGTSASYSEKIKEQVCTSKQIGYKQQHTPTTYSYLIHTNNVVF